MSAAQLITEIYARTGFDLLCRAMPGGKQRFANLSRLAQIAGDYHQRGFRGLTMFLRVIDRLTERGEELPAAYVGEGSNAVTITSIHSSKGLEWPVVFLADAGRRHSFYRHDLNAPPSCIRSWASPASAATRCRKSSLPPSRSRR